MRTNFRIFGIPREEHDLSRVRNCIAIQKKNGNLKPGVEVAVLLENCGLTGRKGDVVIVRDRYNDHFTVDLPWYPQTIAECNKDRPTTIFCSTPIVGIPLKALNFLKGEEIELLFR